MLTIDTNGTLSTINPIPCLWVMSQFAGRTLAGLALAAWLERWIYGGAGSL
jgi:hypothetical protein